MGDLFEKLLVQAPGAAIVIATMIILLRHLKTRDEAWIQAFRETKHKETEIFQETKKVIQENTTMLGRVSGLLDVRIKQVRNGETKWPSDA